MAITIRRAQPKDRKGIERICTNTWGGWDYVPQYFSRWVREKGFYVMLDGRKIIGLAKYTELTPREFWLEGLRIDPACRSHGLGWKLSRFIMKRVLAEKPISLRLTTGRRNRHSRAIIRRMGLRLLVSLYGRNGRVPRRTGKPDVFVPTPEAAYRYIRRTCEFRAAKGMLQHTWQFYTITPKLMQELHARKRLFACGCNENLRGLLIVQPGRYGTDRLDLSFIEGDRKALGEFHKQLALIARRQKAKYLSGMAAGKSVLRHLGGLRLRPRHGKALVRHVMVYEYPLP
jgi:GNAT superfamily N-acetyltransferase